MKILLRGLIWRPRRNGWKDDVKKEMTDNLLKVLPMNISTICGKGNMIRSYHFRILLTHVKANSPSRNRSFIDPNNTSATPSPVVRIVKRYIYSTLAYESSPEQQRTNKPDYHNSAPTASNNQTCLLHSYTTQSLQRNYPLLDQHHQEHPS